MAVAKVTLNGTTLMDTTDATASADKILNTYTAYIKDGTKTVGTLVPQENTDLIITLSYNDQTEMWEPDKTYAEVKTATLHIINEGSGYSSVDPVPVIDTFNDEDFLAVSDPNVLQGSSKDFTLVLYKDRTDLSIGLADNIRYSENVIYDEAESIYIVSGDATITLEGTGMIA